ncbi:recombinase family protein [Streptomyces sp. NPDC014733]|uniref:recombinase family protein n=1 Tax=Streptomyces sp. NPDC014733 TaxID=3364885 RepID=UPI00370348D2
MPRLYGFEDMAYGRVREAEAEGIRAAASRRLLGQPNAAVTAWMNEAGYRTTRGGLWKPDVLAKVLNHPAIAGLREDEHGELIETGGPAIISREDFVAIRAMRPSNNPDYHRAAPREYQTPSKLSVCGLCGHRLGAAPSANGSRGYRCPPGTKDFPAGCGKVRIKAEPFEIYIAENVVAELAKPAVAKVISQARDEVLAEAAALREGARAARQEQKALGNDYVRSPDLSLAAFRAADAELKRTIQEKETKARFLEQVKHAPVGNIPDLARWWTHAPMKSKKGLQILMLEQVALYPAVSKGSRAAVDTDRVALTWRRWGQDQ